MALQGNTSLAGAAPRKPRDLVVCHAKMTVEMPSGRSGHECPDGGPHAVHVKGERDISDSRWTDPPQL